MNHEKRLALVIAVCGLSLLTVPGCLTSPHHPEKGNYLVSSRKVGNKTITFQQQPRVEFDFASEDVLDDFQVINGEWQIKESQLVAVSGERNRSILLTRCGNIQSPFRIEFEATNYANPDGSIGDITILLNASNSKDFFRKGYSLTTGSYYNNCTTFYRLGKAFAKTEYSPIISGRKNKVRVDYDKGHIRYWLNGEIILEAWDPEPLKLDPNLWIGIRTWNTKMVIDSFTIHQGATDAVERG